MPEANLPNAPLGEVVFELRFPGDLGAYAAWGAIQRELRESFPKLLVPRVVDGEFPALKPIQLASDDGSDRLSLAVNLFSYVTQRYVDYGEFRRRYVDLFASFRRHLEPVHLTRIGLRYINWLPPEFPSTQPPRPGQVHPCLKLILSGFPASMAQVEPVLISQMQAGSWSLTVQLGHEPRGARLDFDCYQEGVYPVESVLERLDDAHRVIDELFFGVVTPEYLAYMRGTSP